MFLNLSWRLAERRSGSALPADFESVGNQSARPKGAVSGGRMAGVVLAKSYGEGNCCKSPEMAPSKGIEHDEFGSVAYGLSERLLLQPTQRVVRIFRPGRSIRLRARHIYLP